VRANFVYDTLQHPPPPGSPLEAVCMFVFNCRQREKYVHTVLSTQPRVTQENYESLKKLMDAYEKELFPYSESEKSKESTSLVEVMERESRKGPMRVEAVEQPKMKKNK